MDQGTANAVKGQQKNEIMRITMRWLYVVLMYCGLAYSINLDGQILLFPSTNEFVGKQDYNDASHSLQLWYGNRLLGIKQDRDSAITMFSQQADRGNRYSTYYLYQVLSSSETKLIMAPGVDRDSLGMAYLKKAAALGYHTAEYQLGSHFFYKENNTDSAYYWFCKAIDNSEREMKTSKTKYKQKMFDEWCTLYLAHSYKGACNLQRGLNKLAEEEFILALKKMEYLTKYSHHPRSTYDKAERIYIASAYRTVTQNLICFYYATNQLKDAHKVYNNFGDFCIDNRLDTGKGMPFYFYFAEDKKENEISNLFYVGLAINDIIGGSLGQPYLEKAAENGNRDAKLYLGGKWIEDLAQKGDREAMFKLGGKWLEELALKGDLAAKEYIIRYQLNNKDIASADNWWEKIIQKSDIDSIVNSFKGHPADTLYYRYILEKCANVGNVKAQELLGLSYYAGHENEKAFYWLEKASLKGSSYEVVVRLGHCYRYGYGTNKDIKKAIFFYEKAVQMELQSNLDNTSEFYLAYSYEENKDYSKAFTLFQKLSKVQPLAMYEVGKYYYEGYAGIRDYKKAYDCMKRMEGSHYVEDSRVQYYLGMCYLKGHAVSKDEKKGFSYLKCAVESNWVYPKVFWKIAKCYRFGRGVERDLKKAEYYEQEAEKSGNDDALWMKEQQDLLNVFE